MFWKKQKSPINSNEYEELHKKLVSMSATIDSLSNSVALLDTVVKSNRARIGKIKVDKLLQESEKDIKDEGIVYLGETRFKP